jgi:hypothetical protein
MSKSRSYLSESCTKLRMKPWLFVGNWAQKRSIDKSMVRKASGVVSMSNRVGDELKTSAQGLHKSCLVLTESGESVMAAYPGGRARSPSSRGSVRSGIAGEEAVPCACSDGASTVVSLFD